MKQILFILLSLFLLQTTVQICMGNNVVNGLKTPTCTLTDNLKSKLSDEERTENNFYNFIQYDVIGKDNPVAKGILYYTKFTSANKVYDQIINWIVPISERVKFDKTKIYKSDMMVISYTEDVKDGFAKLTVTFNNRKELKQCTVIFKSIKL